jgi:hypothetical protein
MMERKMSKRILISVIVIMLTACGLMAAPKTSKPKVLAQVGDKTVTTADFDSLSLALRFTITDSTNIDSLKKVVLDSLINQRLVDIRIDSVMAIEPKDRSYRERRSQEVTGSLFKAMYDNEISYKIKVDSAELIHFMRQIRINLPNPKNQTRLYFHCLS